MISILTKPPGFHPFSRKWLARCVKKILGKGRGPEAVISSIIRGFGLIGTDFALDSFSPGTNGKADVAVAVSGVDTAEAAVSLKKAGVIRRLIVGPTIVVTPLDANSLLRKPEIDALLVPSQWVKDFYVSLAPELESKIYIWAAGVKASSASDKSGAPILYLKNDDAKLIESIEQSLREKKIEPTKIIYGSYKKEAYAKALSHAPYMIYVGKTESQGIALHEAWMADVPTLVYNPKTWSNGVQSWTDPKIAAPYMSNACGEFFTEECDSESEFRGEFDAFTTKLGSYSPRSYSLEHFTDRKSAEHLLTIIYENN